MPDFELTILGTSSSQPAYGRFPSCQILQCGNNLYMIDCGEGSQMQMSRYHIKRSKIKAVFISHLHGDHIYGLPGVITSFMHYNRQDKLILIGPKGLGYYIEACLVSSKAKLEFEVEIKEYDAAYSQEVYRDSKISVVSVPLKHNIPTMGYLFKEEVNYLRLNKNFIASLDLTHEDMKALKNGKDIVYRDGQIIRSADACLSKNEGVSYAYISDSAYDESIVPLIENVDVIYHETTYLKDMEEEASVRMHSTSVQAAAIAKKANSSTLICGHYSSRYKCIDQFEAECKSVFEASILGKEGLCLKITKHSATPCASPHSF
jgi:ribonuclease Z